LNSAGVGAVLCAAPFGAAALTWQHFLYFFPLPQGHGSFLPGFMVHHNRYHAGADSSAQKTALPEPDEP
jgi:hypothetical protein